MTLMTDEVAKTLPQLYSQELCPNPKAFVRFYDTVKGWNWYAAEFDGCDVFWGLVCDDYCYFHKFSLSELEEVNRSAGFERIKRDEAFEPSSSISCPCHK